MESDSHARVQLWYTRAAFPHAVFVNNNFQPSEAALLRYQNCIRHQPTSFFDGRGMSTARHV